MRFKLLSWNVNGLRSFKQPMIEFLDDLDADIICLQETKVTRDMLTEDLALVDGYTSYYAFSRRRSGYSGVATYVRVSCTPIFACEGLTGVLTRASSESSSQEPANTQCPSDFKKEQGSSNSHLEGTSLASNSDKVNLNDNCFKALDSTKEMPLLCNGDKESCLSSIIEAATCELPGDWSRHELRELDLEGRTVITIHEFRSDSITSDAGSLTPRSAPQPLAVINVYCPRADPSRDDRALYKLQFYHALRCRAATISNAGARVVVLGDVNTSHTVLDHCDPDGEFHLNPGRQFLDQFLAKVIVERREDGSLAFVDDTNTPRPEPSGRTGLQADDGGQEDLCDDVVDTFQMVDTFRCLYPKRQDAFTCWNTMSNARETNYGTRIDYIFCDRVLLRHVLESLVLKHVMGSDHCPVALLVAGKLLASPTVPQYCTKNFREFQGQQQKLLNYFQKIGGFKEAKEKDLAKNTLHDHNGSNNSECSNQTTQTRLEEVEEELNPLLKFLSPRQSESSSDGAGPLPKNNRDQKSSVYASMKLKHKTPAKQSHKRQQSNLLSFFGAKRKKCDQETGSVQAQEHSLAHGSTDKSSKQLSLYEAEMLFLKNNPGVYKRLALADGRDVDMDILNNASNLQKSETLSNEDNFTDSELHLKGHNNFGDAEGLILTDTSASSLEKKFSSRDISEMLNLSAKLTSDKAESNDRDDRIATVHEEADSDSVTGCHVKAADPKLAKASSAWSFMHQKLEVPLCPGHKEPCALKTTKKKGPNFNRRFFACSRGVGRPGDKDAQCNFFKWV